VAILYLIVEEKPKLINEEEITMTIESNNFAEACLTDLNSAFREAIRSKNRRWEGVEE
jgi:hypothetical protein